LDLEPVHPQDLHFTLPKNDSNLYKIKIKIIRPTKPIKFMILQLKNNYAKVGCKHKLKQDEFCK
jgi:hypothetical protein